MEIKQWIEKAIEGGWDKNIGDVTIYCDKIDNFNLEKILLDPKAWEAVGKVEEWTRTEYPTNPHIQMDSYEVKEYKEKMHQMIDALAEGKTVEEFIKTL